MRYRQYILLIVCFLPFAGLMAQPKQGDIAREIALPSISGDTLKLSSLKGKVVLLDFWASWCVPCRISNRGLTKIYSKYKDKGFEIFGVSLDNETGEWKNAVKRDKIEWLQVNEPGGWMAKTVNDWGISSIPTSYLIDKSGALIAMDLAGKDLEKALKALLEE